MHDHGIIRRTWAAAAATAALASAGLPLQAPPAGASSACAPQGNDPAFAVASRALAGPRGTELALRLTQASPGCAVPDSLKQVQVIYMDFSRTIGLLSAHEPEDDLKEFVKFAENHSSTQWSRTF